MSSGVVQDRAVRVGADLHVGAVLALVAEGVHVADDREGDLALALGELRARADADHLVHRRASAGSRCPAMSPIFGLHTPQAITTCSASMSPPVGADPRGSDRPRRRGRSPRRSGTTVSAPVARACSRMMVPARSESTTPTLGVQKAPMNWSVSMNGTFSLTNSGLTSSASMPQASRARHPAAQLLHPLLGAGDLEAAGLGEDAHLLVLPHRVERQVGDLAGVVDREDEVRRVAGRAARVGQRSLVDLDDVAASRARARWWTRLLPTMPAPMTTTWAVAGDGGHCGSPNSALLRITQRGMR